MFNRTGWNYKCILNSCLKVTKEFEFFLDHQAACSRVLVLYKRLRRASPSSDWLGSFEAPVMVFSRATLGIFIIFTNAFMNLLLTYLLMFSINSVTLYTT